MRLLILFAVLAMCSSCTSNYELEELYGKWEGSSIGFTFNRDGSCDIYMGGGKKWPGKTEFRPVSVGNTLEFTEGGKVIMSNLTIKSLVDDVLIIEMRPMLNPTKTSITHELNRVQ